MIRWIEGADGWEAEAEIPVGVERHVIRVRLGRLAATPDPGGLRQSPVVVVGAACVALAWAGATRAGGEPAIGLVTDDEERAAGHMLGSVAAGAEILIVPDGGSWALTTARALGGRPILPAPVADAAILPSLQIDVHVAMPAPDEERRAAVRALLAPSAPERMHHLVDVDPTPAFRESGLDIRAASLEELAAGAAGVLAGRLAATNRRWRAGA